MSLLKKRTLWRCWGGDCWLPHRGKLYFLCVSLNRLYNLSVHGKIYLKDREAGTLEAAPPINYYNCCYPLNMRIWIWLAEPTGKKPRLMACAGNPVLRRWMQRQADPCGLRASQSSLLGEFRPVRKAVYQEGCVSGGRTTSLSYACSLGLNPSQLTWLLCSSHCPSALITCPGHQTSRETSWVHWPQSTPPPRQMPSEALLSPPSHQSRLRLALALSQCSWVSLTTVLSLEFISWSVCWCHYPWVTRRPLF